MNSCAVISKDFDVLSKAELYAILALRVQVFCVEQNCPYQDLDNQDQQAQHVFIKDNGIIMAYARIIKGKQGVYHIGRVVVDKRYRNQGLATVIMQACIDELKNKAKIIELSAQSYLTEFYQGLGFKSTGEYYLEDDIPHEKMQLILD